MNRERREKIIKIINSLRSNSEDLVSVNFDETYARDNMPANLQDSERYRESEDASEQMEDAIDNINLAIESLGEI